MLPGEELFAFFDDVYILCVPERCRFLHDLLTNPQQFFWFSGLSAKAARLCVCAPRGGKLTKNVDLVGQKTHIERVREVPVSA